MPSELRQIIFSSDETVAAIRQLFQRSNRAFPEGHIAQVTVSPASGCQVDCEIEDDNKMRDRVTVAGEKLAAALLLYCMTRKIPVPAAAAKTLSVVNGHLALCISLHEKVESDGLPPRERVKNFGQTA
jgi:hypothetical protein